MKFPSLILACVALSTVACGAPMPEEDDEADEVSAEARKPPVPPVPPTTYATSFTCSVAWATSTSNATGVVLSYTADRKQLTLSCRYGTASYATVVLKDASGLFGPGAYAANGTGTKTATFSASEHAFLGYPFAFTVTHSASSANPGTSTVTISSYAGPGSRMQGTFAFAPLAGSTLEPMNVAFDVLVPN